MRIAHHPPQDLLLAYAGGGADAATALIVASHLAWCGACRAQVAAMENIGGALLEDVPPIALAPGALAATLARLDSAAPDAPAPPRQPSRDGTPGPLRAFLGCDLSDVRWRRIGPRLAYLPLMRRGAMQMRLLRGAPGTEVGPHSHRGMEYTLVLRGGFSDVTGRYGPGDFQAASPDTRHNPIADPGEDCINLAVTTAPLRFESLIQRIVGPLFGF